MPVVAEVPVPDHNYSANEDGIYLYAQTLSPAQREAGVAAAGFVAFKYLGVKDGLHYLQDENSMVMATCANPCTIIRQTLNGQVVNRIQYNSQTIIGAAFDDAINGKLNLYTQFKEPASSGADKALLTQYADLNEKCRGGSGDDPKTMQACDQRDALSDKLEKAGYCYGEFAEYGFQSSWAKCSADKKPKPEF